MEKQRSEDPKKVEPFFERMYYTFSVVAHKFLRLGAFLFKVAETGTIVGTK